MKLPDFYQLIEIKANKMAPKKDKTSATPTNIQPMEVMEGNKPRTYTAVTVLGNKFTAIVKEEPDKEKKLMEFLKGIHDAIRTFVSISFERAELNDLITNDPDFQHLLHFDPSAIFNADANSLKTAQVMSILTDIQAKVKKPSVENVQETLDRVDKVKLG